MTIAATTRGRSDAVGSKTGGRVRIEAGTGREILSLKGHALMVNCAGVSPDGQRIVTGSDDRSAKVWAAGTGREMLTLKGRTGAVESVSFSPDGRRAVTGSEDGTARVWTSESGAGSGWPLGEKAHQ